MSFIRTLCPACQAAAIEQIDAVPVEEDIGVLDVFCPHERVGAEITIYAGLVQDWAVRPFRDLAQFERFAAEQQTLRRETIRAALAAAASIAAAKH